MCHYDVCRDVFLSARGKETRIKRMAIFLSFARYPFSFVGQFLAYLKSLFLIFKILDSQSEVSEGR